MQAQTLRISDSRAATLTSAAGCILAAPTDCAVQCKQVNNPAIQGRRQRVWISGVAGEVGIWMRKCLITSKTNANDHQNSDMNVNLGAIM